MPFRGIFMANGDKAEKPEVKVSGESAKLMDSNNTIYVRTLASWRDRHGLKPGDTVMVIDDGKDSLIIKPMDKVLNGSQ